MKKIFKSNISLICITTIEIIILALILKTSFNFIKEYKRNIVMSDADTKFADGIDFAAIRKEIKSAYPVGGIYITTSSANPSTTLGGTWQAFATGRALVAVDTSQTEFSTVEKTGGHKEIQEHNHNFYAWWTYRDIGSYRYASAGTNSSVSAGGSGTWNFGGAVKSGSGTGTALTWSGNSGSYGNGNGKNLQPYITVYMWKRTA